jgi:hypothetical protein
MLHLNGEHIIEPDPLTIRRFATDGTYLCDTYSVRLEWPSHQVYPTVYEIGGRIEAVAANLEVGLEDVHVYPAEKALCLASWTKLETSFAPGFELSVFINEFLVPYLYAQTYFSKTHTWPWGELSHGYIGILEELGRMGELDINYIKLARAQVTKLVGERAAQALFSIRPRPHHKCPCGSDRTIRKCHPEVQAAIAKIRFLIRREALG